jgi:hypothetical protein
MVAWQPRMGDLNNRTGSDYQDKAYAEKRARQVKAEASLKEFVEDIKCHTEASLKEFIEDVKAIWRPVW